MASTKKGRISKQAGKEAAVASRAGGRGCPVLVVGVGAAAGDLTPLKRLLARMPAGRGLAFVVIRHAGRSQANRTAKGLQGQTAFSVVNAEDGMPVLADRVHVVPAGRFFSIAQGRLSLHEPENCNGLRMPIDYFFCTLASDQRDRSCGILLSGPSRDGRLGLSEIKAVGGRTIVQSPGKARVPNMPQSAIDAEVVDVVLELDDVAAAVLAFAAQVSGEMRRRPAEPPQPDADLRAILDLLRVKVGHDFRCFKPATLVRRVRRRMTLAKLTTYGDYARFLHEHPEEVTLLQKDLLIGVTEFFRQPQAWDLLEEKVIARLVETAEPEAILRLWVPACSSGQEVYSLAMLVTEQIERAGKKMDFQLFATDTDPSALARARAGIYTQHELGPNVSSERRRRFFTLRDGRYQAVKALRERVVFAPQNLTADPPFSRLDLVSCRNLLIYLEPPVQKKLIALFHFALRDGGYLFLGSAETVGDREDLFEPVSKKWRIYRRIGGSRRPEVEIPVRACEASSAAAKLPAPSVAPRLSLAAAARQALLERFAPASVLVDRKLQVLYTHGAIEQYLAFPGGELTTNIVNMAREGLRARLRGAIGKSIEAGKSVALTARVRRGPKSVPVSVFVSPLHHPRETDGLLLIAFEDTRLPAETSRRLAAGESDIRQLEDELRITREELQSSIEQLESSNERLKASNEEVTAANEELQSANEELETSKEELQFLNEELNTINARLQEKVDELEAANNDVVNLLASTHIATVFLDRELKVKRYTPSITRLLSLIPTDVGRPMADIRRRFSDEALLNDAARVLEDLTPLSREVQADDGRWYIRRITPYRTQDDRIEGAVVTFVDVSDLKQAGESIQSAALFPEENPFPVLRVGGNGGLLYANRSASGLLELWGCHLGAPVPEFVQRTLKTALGSGIAQELEVRCNDRDLSFELIPIVERNYVNFYGRDSTERKQAEQDLQKSKARLARAQEIAHLGSWELDLVRNELTWSDEVYRIFGLQPQEFGATYGAFLERVHPEDRAAVDEAYSGSLRENRDAYEIEHRVVRKDTGDIRVVHERCQHHRDASGKIVRSVGMVHDITERKQAEKALEDSQAALRKANEELEQKVRERTATLAHTVDSLQEEIDQRQRAEEEFRRANEQLNARAAQLRALAGELTMAEQRERKRMAQILHDHLQQQLASAKLQVSCLDELDGEALVLAATQIEELLGESIRLSRSLTAELSPPILHEAGLAAGLEWLARWMADKHGLKVELAIEEDLPAVAEDVKVLLFESIRELLFNAAKHARVATARVVLRRIDGKTLKATVSDNGPGFDPSKMKAPGESGAGFGLLSIRERLGLVGGRLEIDSAPGNGSRFLLTAPLLQAEAAAEPDEVRREIPPVCLPEPGARIRVLLADDHAVMRQSLALMLSQEPDIDVVGEAQDGAEAVELAGKLRPDVILMDISMPGMNGIDATRSISGAYPEICVIGLSMYEEGERSQAIRSAGAIDYVTKSAPKAHLIAAIRDCTGGGSG